MKFQGLPLLKLLETLQKPARWDHPTADALHLFFFCIFALYISYAPGPHNKANLCCTTLRVAGLELHMYLPIDLPTFLLTAEERRVNW